MATKTQKTWQAVRAMDAKIEAELRAMTADGERMRALLATIDAADAARSARGGVWA